MKIVVLNQSIWVSDDDAARWTAAIARQVHEDLAPVWKVDADVSFQQTAPDGAWICTLDDDGTAESTLTFGIHAVGPDGNPYCKVHAGLIVTSQAGTVSYTLSHEILEMLVDPWLGNMTLAAASGPNSATVFLREICDPVAGSNYQIDGVTVADFTYPEFWLGGKGVGIKFDQLAVATLALQPAAHSYMLVRYITTFGGINSLDTWNYIWGSYCMLGPC